MDSWSSDEKENKIRLREIYKGIREGKVKVNNTLSY